MTTKETLRFIKNNDSSTIMYRDFSVSSKDTYPAFSFCLTDRDDEANSLGSIYSFFKDELEQTLEIPSALRDEGPEFMYVNLEKILKGEVLDSTEVGAEVEAYFDIQNISNSYANTFTIHLMNLYSRIEFKAKNTNDSVMYDSDVDNGLKLPFYTSYQDPERVCFTRKNDRKDGIIRIEDILSLKDTLASKFNGTGSEMTSFEFFVHHPGQLLRDFQNPIFQSSAKNLYWNKLLELFTTFYISIEGM